MFSSFIFQENHIIRHSTNGTIIKEGAEKYVLMDTQYYKKNGVIEVGFLVDSPSTFLDNNIETIVKIDGKTKGFSTETQKINNEYYVVFITTNNATWKEIALTIRSKSVNNSLSSSDSKFYLAHEKINKKEQFKVLPLATYQKRYFDYAINYQKLLIKNIDLKIEKKEKEITELKDKNAQLLESVEFKTESERKKMQQQISTNNNSITEVKKTKEKLKKEISEYEEKIEKLRKASKFN